MLVAVPPPAMSSVANVVCTCISGSSFTYEFLSLITKDYVLVRIPSPPRPSPSLIVMDRLRGRRS